MLSPFTPEQLEFIQAVERFKAERNKAYLSWTEVLEIVKSLGYERRDPVAESLAANPARVPKADEVVEQGS